MVLRIAMLAAIVLQAAACGIFDPDDDFPESFRITGTAEGAHGLLDITCSLELNYERTGGARRGDGRFILEIAGGGSATRTVLDETGAGVSLQPFLHSFDDEIHLISGDSLEIVSPLNLDSPDPFYRLIGRLTGRRSGGDHATGTWACGPFNTREDLVGVVVGTWELAPHP